MSDPPAKTEPPKTIVLTLHPVADPMARMNHGYERDTMYRLRVALKQLLRAHGFRCSGVRYDPPIDG